MVLSERHYQVITLLVVVLIFDLSERIRPGFEVNRGKEFILNVFAMIFVIIIGEAAKKLVQGIYSLINLNKANLAIYLANFPGFLKIILAIIFTDFSLYWVHWAMHKRLLWKTHAFHHSILEIWWLAGSRTSFLHLFLFSLPQIFIGYHLLKLNTLQAGIAFSFGVFVNIWIHTNLWLNIGILDKIIITPNYHRIHHGSRGLMNSNFGFVFTIWDKMFGTYSDPASVGKEFKIYPASTTNRLIRMMIGL